MPSAEDRSVASYHDAAALPADVRAFMSTASVDRLSADADWYANLCEHVPHLGASANYLVLRTAGQPVAVLPLTRTTPGHGGSRHVQSLANYYTALYMPVLAQGLVANELLPLLQTALFESPRATRITLTPMDPTAPEYSLLREALGKLGWPTFPFFSAGNWYLEVPASWTGYLASRSANFRSNLKRAVKRFESEAGRLEIISTESGLAAGMDAYERVYRASWKVQEAFPDFVRGLAHMACRRDGLRLGIAWLAEKPIAAQLWLVSGRRAEIYKVAYDEAYKALSPGAVVTGHLMRHVIEVDSVQEVDFLIGDDEYKSTWMSHRRERWGLVAYNVKTLPGALGLVREIASRQLKRAMTAAGKARTLASFAVVGVLATLLHWGIAALLLMIASMGAVAASTIGFVLSAVFNFLTNARVTFGTKRQLGKRRLDFCRCGHGLWVECVGAGSRAPRRSASGDGAKLAQRCWCLPGTSR